MTAAGRYDGVMREMQPMNLAEIKTAPFRIERHATFEGTPRAMFAQLAEPARWLDWFPLMYSARWTSAQTTGVGAEREVRLRVFGDYRERVLAWDPSERFAFTMLASTSPLVTRMAEDWRITRDGRSVRLDWTVGAYPSMLGRAATPVLRRVLGTMFTRGGSKLRRLLREHGTQVA